MALIQLSFKSKALLLQTSVNIILPMGTNRVDFTPAQDFTYEHKKYPVLYLLHGASDDHSSWLRLSSIERYAEEKELVIVMPNADMSAYNDMVHGQRYWTYINEELPQFLQAAFPISDKREDTFAAGLSMGGYGAFKLALRNPDRFAAAASLSGAVDIIGSLKDGTFFSNAFGDSNQVDNRENDLYHLINEVAEQTGPKPKLFQACGTEDFLYEDNVKFKDYAKDLAIDLTYEEGPGGHDWSYWDTYIQRVLNWLPIESNQTMSRS